MRQVTRALLEEWIVLWEGEKNGAVFFFASIVLLCFFFFCLIDFFFP